MVLFSFFPVHLVYFSHLFDEVKENTPSAVKEYATENGRNGETETFKDKETRRLGDKEKWHCLSILPL
ncbi:hypothetical protein KAX97_13830, partial [candidate division WOR-3 bacterium]|nr:hypothetical protein [candidate division WOR-3 bacterium]